jgi:hypothetical protein
VAFNRRRNLGQFFMKVTDPWLVKESEVDIPLFDKVHQVHLGGKVE